MLQETDRLFYTGVGSRKTPIDILKKMTRMAYDLANLGYLLRSGHALGADTAFENGALFSKVIYLARDATPESIDFANEFYPDDLTTRKPFVQKLHGRNPFQVVGKDLDNPVLSKFLVCWTPDGCIAHETRTYATGGTGTSISIADHFKIPIFNLQREGELERFNLFIKGITEV